MAAEASTNNGQAPRASGTIAASQADPAKGMQTPSSVEALSTHTDAGLPLALGARRLTPTGRALPGMAVGLVLDQHEAAPHRPVGLPPFDEQLQPAAQLEQGVLEGQIVSLLLVGQVPG